MSRMKPFLILGASFILAGLLGLLQAFGFLKNASEIFWGVLFLLGALMFLLLAGQGRSKIPAFFLAGIGVFILLPDSFENLAGALFLSVVGLGFWFAYLTGRETWWAIIPGGVALTLAIVAGFQEQLTGALPGLVFLSGLAVTFLLVALLAGMRWAYWLAGVLGVLGIIFSLPSCQPITSYFGAALLVGAGIYMIWRSIRSGG